MSDVNNPATPGTPGTNGTLPGQNGTAGGAGGNITSTNTGSADATNTAEATGGAGGNGGSGASGSGSAGAGGTAANSWSAVTGPTAPNSTSAYTMQGLAGSITPTFTGIVLVTISGTLISSANTINEGIKYQISYGTGIAPASNATLTGTQVGVLQEYTNPVAVTAADVHVPFSISTVIAGLSLNTAYWIDLAAEAVTAASIISLTNVSISIIELGSHGSVENVSITGPTGPASNSSYAMQGLNASITPVISGDVFVQISGTIITPGTTAGNGIKYQISYGTSTPPVSNGPLAGTQVGLIQEYTNPTTVTSADVHAPFSISVVISGLSLGGSVWIDLAAESTFSVGVAFTNVSVIAIEV